MYCWAVVETYNFNFYVIVIFEKLMKITKLQFKRLAQIVVTFTVDTVLLFDETNNVPESVSLSAIIAWRFGFRWYDHCTLLHAILQYCMNAFHVLVWTCNDTIEGLGLVIQESCTKTLCIFIDIHCFSKGRKVALRHGCIIKYKVTKNKK